MLPNVFISSFFRLRAFTVPANPLTEASYEGTASFSSGFKASSGEVSTLSSSSKAKTKRKRWNRRRLMSSKISTNDCSISRTVALSNFFFCRIIGIRWKKEEWSSSTAAMLRRYRVCSCSLMPSRVGIERRPIHILIFFWMKHNSR